MERRCSKTIGKYFSNTEIKYTSLYVIIIMTISLVISIVSLNILLSEINKNIVRKDIEITGKLIEKYPELEDDFMELIDKETTDNEMVKGKEYLSQYGYKEDMNFKFQNSLNSVYGKAVISISGSLLFLAIILFAIIFLGFSKVYSKVEHITFIMEKVMDGDFSYSLKDDGEELFDMLGFQFNKMSNCFKLSIYKLRKEKIFLKNIIEDISHQLKTPIATLIAANDIMSTETDMPQDTRQYFIERSKKQLERIEWLVKNLLKLAKLDAGIIIFKKTKVSVMPMIKKAVSSIDYLRKEKNITISIKENIVGSCFLGDDNWTREAVLNIVKNSIEHTPDNGQVVISIEEMKLLTKIIISDNGEGIEPNEITKIFERFHKCKSKYKDDSVGIGLSLSKKIVEGQGGIITVESEVGKGSSFTITFKN